MFAQSHVDEHTRLSYLMECTASDGEMRRMIQYKEKAAREQARGGSVRLSLLTYPALMAADILAYGTHEVPVGEDQAQHVELTRDLAVRFNQRYGHDVRGAEGHASGGGGAGDGSAGSDVEDGEVARADRGDRLSAGRARGGAEEGDAGGDGQRGRMSSYDREAAARGGESAGDPGRLYGW